MTAPTLKVFLDTACKELFSAYMHITREFPTNIAKALSSHGKDLVVLQSILVTLVTIILI